MTTTVRIGLSQEPDSLFPGMQAMASAGDILAPLTTRPLHYDDVGTPHPRVLERIPTLDDGWELTPQGGMRITYRWRPGYRWHDGVPLTAHDAVWTWRLRLDPRVKVDSRWYDPQIEDMTAPDPLTLVVTWKRRLATANHYYLILPQHALESEYERDPGGLHSCAFARQPLSTGPYRFCRWIAGDSITLEAVAGFCEGQPAIDRLVFRFLGDPDDMATALLTGEIDAMATNNLTIDQALDLARIGRGRVHVHFQPSFAVERVDFNLGHPLLSRQEIRMGLAWAIDRDRVVAVATGGQGEAAQSWLPSRHRAYRPQTIPGGNADRAADLFRSAGCTLDGGQWVDDRGDAVQLSLLTTLGDASRSRAASELAAQWRKFGIQVTVRTQPARIVFAAARQRRFDLLLYSWLMHPDTIGRGAWHSTQVPHAGNGYSGHNFAGWSNRDGDILLERAEEAFSEPERWELLARHQRLFAQDMPALPLHQRVDITARRVGLEQFRPGGSSVTPATWNAHHWTWAARPVEG